MQGPTQKRSEKRTHLRKYSKLQNIFETLSLGFSLQSQCSFPFFIQKLSKENMEIDLLLIQFETLSILIIKESPVPGSIRKKTQKSKFWKQHFVHF